MSIEHERKRICMEIRKHKQVRLEVGYVTM